MSLEQQQDARNLFFQTDLTQLQIADQVGVSQKTISIWANEGRWQKLKELSVKTPAIMIEEMYNELAEINLGIRNREPGFRFATPKEADTRRKLLASIRYVKEQQSAGSHMEVLINFSEFLKTYQPTLVKDVVLAADAYLRGEKRMGQKNKFTPYDLQSGNEPAEQEQQPEKTTQQEPKTQPQDTEKPTQQPPKTQPQAAEKPPKKKEIHKKRPPRTHEERAREAWNQFVQKVTNDTPRRITTKDSIATQTKDTKGKGKHNHDANV